MASIIAALESELRNCEEVLDRLIGITESHTITIANTPVLIRFLEWRDHKPAYIITTLDGDLIAKANTRIGYLVEEAKEALCRNQA